VIDILTVFFQRLVVPLARVADAPAQFLQQLSDDADEVWEPFLMDPEPRLLAADRRLVA
jgi:hypothetical protein